MFEVEQRCFITEDKYNELIEKFNKDLKSTSQITYYYSGDKDFRIMVTKDYVQMWLKEGKMHDDSREEYVVKIDTNYKKDLRKILQSLGYSIEIKWYRKRNETNYNGYFITIDYTVGYGYIIEVEKKIDDEKLVEQTKKELLGLLEEFGVSITPKDEFNKRFADYKLNYKDYTSNIDEDEFIGV